MKKRWWVLGLAVVLTACLQGQQGIQGEKGTVGLDSTSEAYLDSQLVVLKGRFAKELRHCVGDSCAISDTNSKYQVYWTLSLTGFRSPSDSAVPPPVYVQKMVNGVAQGGFSAIGSVFPNDDLSVAMKSNDTLVINQYWTCPPGQSQCKDQMDEQIATEWNYYVFYFR